MSTFASVLPKHLTADRLVRIACAAASREPKLLECTSLSILSSLMMAAQLGLEPGVMGMGYLIPFWNRKAKPVAVLECQFMPGYRGLIDIARRSGAIVSIDADVVYENDSFAYSKGIDLILKHEPRLVGQRGKPICAYAVARLKDGGVQIVVLPLEEIESIRSRGKSEAGPWVSDWGEMAKKTAIKRLCKYLPASIELRQAVAADDRVESQETQSDIVAELDTAEDLLLEEPPAAQVQAPYKELPPSESVIFSGTPAEILAMRIREAKTTYELAAVARTMADSKLSDAERESLRAAYAEQRAMIADTPAEEPGASS
jgi:recombination protein RecT